MHAIKNKTFYIKTGILKAQKWSLINSNCAKTLQRSTADAYSYNISNIQRTNLHSGKTSLNSKNVDFKNFNSKVVYTSTVEDHQFEFKNPNASDKAESQRADTQSFKRKETIRISSFSSHSPYPDSASTRSEDFPVILQFTQDGQGCKIPEVQGANRESRLALSEIDTHSVFDPFLGSGESITYTNEPQHEDVTRKQTVYPFGLHQPINQEQQPSENRGCSDTSFTKSEINHVETPRNEGRRTRRRRSTLKSTAEERTSGDSSNIFTPTKKDPDPDFEILTDDLDINEAKKLLSLDDKFKYGTADSSISSSNVPCSGCGAHLHCQDSKMPGFLPFELFSTAESQAELRELWCQRCYIMKKYDVALKLSVSPEDYPKTIEHLKSKKAIIILVVDLTDFPGSVWPDIINQLGPNKRILLVGNKVDLLPADSKDYLKRVEQSMLQTFKEKCARYFRENAIESNEEFLMPEIASTVLISARTGFNVEWLITKIYSFWKQNRREVGGDIYLIGTTNVGKSSLFNMLVDSDLCKTRALDRVNKAMISKVPGTTLNLLKFPISRPDPSRLMQRYLRLKKEEHVFRTADAVRINQLRKTRDRKYSILGHPVGRTFTYHQDKQTIFELDAFNVDPMANPKSPEKPKVIDPNEKIFVKGNWCYDTPGTVSPDQLINILTQEEIRKTLPEALPIQPRSFLLRVGQSMFLGGLGRFDVLEGPSGPVVGGVDLSRPDFNLMVTVFVSDSLPINIVYTKNAEKFHEEALQLDMLVAPSNEKGTNTKRLEDFPDLEGETMMIDGVGRQESSCDIVFSSAGWVSCTPGVAQIFKVKAWTPGGRGLVIRDPPFLPEAIKLRGRRIKHTPAYEFGRAFYTQKD